MITIKVLPTTCVRSTWRLDRRASHGLIYLPSIFSQRWHSTQRKISVLSGEAQNTSSSDKNASQLTELPPHSLMPRNMLIRASLVSTISSKPILLNMALSILTYLTKTKISFLQVGKNPVIHSILKQTFYNHFCAGENGAEVTNTIKNLKNIGFKGVILTYAKEIVVDAKLDEQGKGTKDVQSGKGDLEAAHSPDIDSWKEGVLTTVRLLGEDDFLALKFTGAGATVMTSLSTTKTIPDQMYTALSQICTEALALNVRILIDAEQQSVQPGIDAVALDLMRKYNRAGSPAAVYNTYQAYLKSTPETLQSHLATASAENFTLGVKLVRGAYMASEPRHLINDTKADTDTSYNNITEGLLTQSYVPFSTSPTTATSFPSASLFLATHNKDSATAAHALHKSRVVAEEPTVGTVQYGQLLGMADEVSCSLLQMGWREERVVPEVYKCLSWGPLEDCLSYLLRRARENKDAVGRSRAEYLAVWAEVGRRVKGAVGL